MKTKFLALFLLVVLLTVALVSCGGQDPDPTETTASTTTAATTTAPVTTAVTTPLATLPDASQPEDPADPYSPLIKP